MFCSKCHAEISDSAKFCPICGTPAPVPFQPGANAQPGTPFQPGANAQPGTPFQPGANAQPGTPFQPGANAQPGTPFQSGANSQPGTPFQTSVNAQSGAPFQQTIPDQPTFSSQPEIPVQQYSEAPAVARKKLNPLAIIIPAVSVVVLAAVALVLYFLVFSKPSASLTSLKNALEEQDFRTALEISEQLPDADCEKALEDYITELLSADGDELEENNRIIRKMFSKGFDKYEEVYQNYQDGEYYPILSDNSDSSQTSSGVSYADSSQNDTSSDTSSYNESLSSAASEPDIVYDTEAPDNSDPDVSVPELRPVESYVGHWRREVRSGWYEDIVFLEDGTGYIYSDLVSEKVSKTNSDYLYYDGKIHFEWTAENNEVTINADIDPYCFVAYQGYAAPYHYSIATWMGSKNGSHDYSFSYDTQDEYLCDMLGVSSTSPLYSGDSLTKDYWVDFLDIADDAWDIYFNHNAQLDTTRYPIDYDELKIDYYNTLALREQYEDIDLYHFVLFTKYVLMGTYNPTTISLNFHMEDYNRVD